jgi:hypothetical protein
MSRVLAIRTHSMDKAEEKRVGQFVIEKDVPIPDNHVSLNEVLAAMEVGESFTHKRRIHVIHDRLPQALRTRRYTVRRVSDGLFRCWRVK